jgi:hypothetical protein
MTYKPGLRSIEFTRSSTHIKKNQDRGVLCNNFLYMSDLKDPFLFFAQSSSNWDGLKEGGAGGG